MTFLGSLLAGVGFSIQMSGRGRGRGRGAVPPSVASAPFSYGSSNGSNASGSTQAIYTSRTEPSQKFPVILFSLIFPIVSPFLTVCLFQFQFFRTF